MTTVASAAIGEIAPDFELMTETGSTWRLSEQKGSVVTLLFYPRDETLMCTRQLCSVRDNWSEYLETKAVIVGISPGRPEDHLSFRSRHQLPLTLLADPGRAVTGIYGSHWLFPLSIIRSIVVIDANQVVRSRRVMLRAFRPADDSVITSIYAARGDALRDRYVEIRDKFRSRS